jgi:hypothetical protein
MQQLHVPHAPRRCHASWPYIPTDRSVASNKWISQSSVRGPARCYLHPVSLPSMFRKDIFFLEARLLPPGVVCAHVYSPRHACRRSVAIRQKPHTRVTVQGTSLFSNIERSLGVGIPSRHVNSHVDHGSTKKKCNKWRRTIHVFSIWGQGSARSWRKVSYFKTRVDNP